MKLATLSFATLAAVAPITFAQCAFTTSMVDTYIASSPIDANADQHPLSGWTFERSGPAGNARILLDGVTGSWLGGAWGAPTQPFFVPLAGPVYSPTPSLNQIPFYRRLPSFTGLMLHPGYNADASRAIITVQHATTLNSFSVQAEHLGAASPTYVISALIERVSGTTQTIIPATTVASLAAAITLQPTGGTLPLVLNAGDRLIVQTTNGGDPSEDWTNVNVLASMSGPPLIATQALVHANCGNDTTARIVAQGAASYRWRRAGIDLNDGPTGSGSAISGSSSPQLTIADFALPDEDAYDCVVTNACGSTTSAPVLLTRCFADRNCDGGVDGDDVIAFFDAWDQSLPAGDFTGDGGVDGDDVIAFFERWDSGC